jgi:hypothetical protein
VPERIDASVARQARNKPVEPVDLSVLPAVLIQAREPGFSQPFEQFAPETLQRILFFLVELTHKEFNCDQIIGRFGAAAKRIVMSNNLWPTLDRAAKALILCLLLTGSYLDISRQAFAASRFDGKWNLVFATERGPCDSTYNFTVDIVNGNVTHPNILTLRGRVAPSGAVRASVSVGQAYASGFGRLSGISGRGVWSGRSGGTRCAGIWAAQRG